MNLTATTPLDSDAAPFHAASPSAGASVRPSNHRRRRRTGLFSSAPWSRRSKTLLALLVLTVLTAFISVLNFYVYTLQLQRLNLELMSRATEVKEELFLLRGKVIDLQRNLQLLAAERLATLRAIETEEIIVLDKEMVKNITFNREQSQQQLLEYRLMLVNDSTQVKPVQLDIVFYNDYGVEIDRDLIGAKDEMLAPHGIRAYSGIFEIRTATPRYFDLVER